MADANDQAAFLARLRDYLKDAVGPFLWTDKTLRICLNLAVSEYSGLFPYTLRASMNVAAGQSYFDLLAAVGSYSIFDVAEVRLAGQRLERDDSINDGIDTLAPARQSWTYDAAQGAILIRNEAISAQAGSGKLIALVHLAHYRWTVDAADPATTSILPHDWELVLLMAARAAWRQVVQQGIKATPFDIDPGDNVIALDTEIAAQLRNRLSRLKSSRLRR